MEFVVQVIGANGNVSSTLPEFFGKTHVKPCKCVNFGSPGMAKGPIINMAASVESRVLMVKPESR
jgi:hypothetical protein